MLLTKECDYGLRIIRNLAEGEKKVVGSICETEHIPYQYAYKILKKLERAGFVKSYKGREGGYKLAKALDTFTILDIASAVDKNLFLFECLREDKPCHFKVPDTPCAVHMEYERIQNILIREMGRNSISRIMSGAG